MSSEDVDANKIITDFALMGLLNARESVFNSIKEIRKIDPPRSQHDLKLFMKTAYIEWARNPVNSYFHEALTERPHIDALNSFLNMMSDDLKQKLTNAIKQVSLEKQYKLSLNDINGNKCIGSFFIDTHYKYLSEEKIKEIKTKDNFSTYFVVVDDNGKTRINLKDVNTNIEQVVVSRNDTYVIDKIISLAKAKYGITLYNLQIRVEEIIINRKHKESVNKTIKDIVSIFMNHDNINDVIHALITMEEDGTFIGGALYYNTHFLFNDYANLLNCSVMVIYALYYNPNMTLEEFNALIESGKYSQPEIQEYYTLHAPSDKLNILNVNCTNNKTARKIKTRFNNTRKLNAVEVLRNALQIRGGSIFNLKTDEDFVAYATLKDMSLSGGALGNLPPCTFDLTNNEAVTLKKIFDRHIAYLEKQGVSVSPDLLRDINAALNELSTKECELSKELDDLSYLMKNACKGNIYGVTLGTDMLKNQKDNFLHNVKQYETDEKKLVDEITKLVIEKCGKSGTSTVSGGALKKLNEQIEEIRQTLSSFNTTFVGGSNDVIDTINANISVISKNLETLGNNIAFNDSFIDNFVSTLDKHNFQQSDDQSNDDNESKNDGQYGGFLKNERYLKSLSEKISVFFTNVDELRKLIDKYKTIKKELEQNLALEKQTSTAAHVMLENQQRIALNEIAQKITDVMNTTNVLLREMPEWLIIDHPSPDHSTGFKIIQELFKANEFLNAYEKNIRKIKKECISIMFNIIINFNNDVDALINLMSYMIGMTNPEMQSQYVNEYKRYFTNQRGGSELSDFIVNIGTEHKNIIQENYNNIFMTSQHKNASNKKIVNIMIINMMLDGILFDAIKTEKHNFENLEVLLNDNILLVSGVSFHNTDILLTGYVNILLRNNIPENKSPKVADENIFNNVLDNYQYLSDYKTIEDVDEADLFIQGAINKLQNIFKDTPYSNGVPPPKTDYTAEEIVHAYKKIMDIKQRQKSITPR